MHFTLKKTLELVLESGNDYLVSVKDNQPHLHIQLQAIAQVRPVLKGHQSEYRQRGRFEQRIVQVFSAAGLEQSPGAATVLRVERHSLRNGKAYEATSFYLSSMETHAQRWQQLIRGHWSIENRLHWPKDVLLKEDDSMNTEVNALLNASLFRTIVINILRLNGFQSPASALRALANQVDRIFHFLL